MTITNEQLTTLHDRLADISVVTKGFKLGVQSNPNGNQEQRKAMVEFADYIMANLIDSKKIVQANLKL